MKSFNHYLESLGEIGVVEFVTKDVVGVTGLPGVKPNELVVFESGQIGMVILLNHDSVEILVFDETPIKSRTKVSRTNEILTIPSGKSLLGQTINPLGHPLNGSKSQTPRPEEKRPLVIEPPSIEERSPITELMETGVAIVDMMLPLGHGQRELIIGDRKTGKTTFLLQTVLSQAKNGTICIWALIGKKQREIKQISEYFKSHQVSKNIILVASASEDAAGLIYLTPYSAVALAEYFKEQGQNTLVVLDDLTTHAKYYREFSLLSRRFPGREAYPVDIFFIHAALMERGGNFIYDGKNVSITILPAAETNEGDLSGYIQTNLMSMTDGHLYFDKDLFSKGQRPSINPFLSVTRVGRQTQTPLSRDISRELMAFLVNFQKMSNFVHFGTELTDEVQRILKKGKRISEFFNQNLNVSIPINIALFIICGLWLDFWQEVSDIDIKKKYSEFIAKYSDDEKFHSAIDKIIRESDKFETLLEKVRQFNNF